MTQDDWQAISTDSLGVVVPAYKPDTDQLIRYVQEISEVIDPARIRIELDVPDTEVTRRLRETTPPATELSTSDTRRGKGAAITAGFETLIESPEISILGFLDADASTPVNQFQRVLGGLTEADIAVGTRRHPDAQVDAHQTVLRRVLGGGFGVIARNLLDVKLSDYQCGAKAITAEAWHDVREYLYTPGFGWDVELVAVADALSYAIKEVPIRWNDRQHSTVSPILDPIRMFVSLFRARHRARLACNRPLHRRIDRMLPGQPLYRQGKTTDYP